MSRRTTFVVLVIGLLVCLVAATVHGPASPGPTSAPTVSAPTATPEVSPSHTAPPPGRGAPELPPISVPNAPRLLVRGVLVASLVALVVLLGRALVRRLRRHRTHRSEAPPRQPESTPRPVLLEEDEATEQRLALGSGTPRNGIVAAWVELERTLVRRGTAPHPSETPTEVATRLLRDHDVPADAVDTLLAAYGEARFSRHDLDESDRARAADALARIHAALLPGERP